MYVSPTGHAAWTGSLPNPNSTGTDGPLPDLGAARDRIRLLRSRGSNPKARFTVRVRSGVYALAETLVLSPQDSNCEYVAFPGGFAVISGGAPVGAWSGTPGGLMVAPVDPTPTQLFLEGRRVTPARLPEHGFYRIDGPSAQTKPFTLHYRDGDIKPAWTQQQAEVIALLAWAELRMPIVSIDEASRTATFAANPRPSNRETDARYWVENTTEGLQSPGSWRYDAKSRDILYHPLPHEDVANEHAVVPRLPTLVRIAGADHLSFTGLQFSYAESAIPAGGHAEIQAAMQASALLEAGNAEGLSISHCTFAHNGGYAIWLRRGSRNSRIVGNTIFDMGAGGIRIGETAVPESPSGQVTGNVVNDNEIHDIGITSPSAVGIWIGQSSGNTIAHNHIHHTYYTAISVGWTWGYGPAACAHNLIEANSLHDIGQNMLSDMGAIYTLGNQPGTVVRNNIIHDVSAFAYGGWGIYTDEGSAGILIENNIVYRTSHGGFHQHYGRENIVRNNIFAFGRDAQLRRTRAESHSSFTVESNIVYFDSGELLEGDWSGNQFTIDRNLYWNAGGGKLLFAGRTWEQWQAAGNDLHSLIANPLFRNASSFDFRLQPGSPAEKIGFHQIETATVGPRPS